MNFSFAVDSIKDLYSSDNVPLHAPVFIGKEKEYVLDTINSTFVSSVGEYVNKFEEQLQHLCNVNKAVACSNGTSALEMCLRVAGVHSGDYVITQALSFVATANAVSHVGAECIFLDIDKSTLGLSPKSLEDFLEKYCAVVNEECVYKKDNRPIRACVPMHTFGFPVEIDKIKEICNKWCLLLIEDAAEALGSKYKDRLCGSFGLVSALSFNGNKIVTTGGGGAVLTNNEDLGNLAKKLTTTSKVPHRWKFFHDNIAWNYRLPNLNAALGCAQLENLDYFLTEKRKIAKYYEDIFTKDDLLFVKEPKDSISNYWLCAVLLPNRKLRDEFLEYTNNSGVMTRPVWEPLNTLPMYSRCIHDNLINTKIISDRLVNIPSGVIYEQN